MSENIESNSALVKSESNFGAGEQPVSESNADYAACLSALTYDDRRQLKEIAQDIERIEEGDPADRRETRQSTRRLPLPACRGRFHRLDHEATPTQLRDRV